MAGHGIGVRQARAAALGLTALLCASCATEPQRAAPLPEPPPRVESDAPFAWGTARTMSRELAPVGKALAGVGLEVANAPCAWLRWEPGAVPDWERVDAWVVALQSAGIRDLELCLDFHALRASDTLLKPRSDLPADPEQRAALAEWAASVVERYDDDGDFDAPGLDGSVRRFRIGSDLHAGGIEPFADYPELLVRFQTAFREASDRVVVVLPPLRARGAPPGAVAARLDALATATDVFDEWTIEASGSAEELDAWLAWLAVNGGGKPIQVIGGTTAPVAEEGAPSRCDQKGPERARLGPATPESDRCAIAAAFDALLRGSPEAIAWARASAARNVVTKGLVLARRGVRRAELASATDATWWSDPSFHAAAGLAAWSGLLERDGHRGYPAFFAYRQLERALARREEIERLPLDSQQVHVYALDGNDGRAWVGWYEPPHFVGPGDPLPPVLVQLDIDADRVRVEHTVTEVGVTSSEASVRELGDEPLWIELTPTPAFVYPD
ncbi:MAG: hypothetical protein AAF430_09880 [Myxococcota bacterium]